MLRFGTKYRVVGDVEFDNESASTGALTKESHWEIEEKAEEKNKPVCIKATVRIPAVPINTNNEN